MEYRVETPVVDLPNEQALMEAVRANMNEWRAVRPGHKIATFARSRYDTQTVGEVDGVEITEATPGRYWISVRWRTIATIGPGEDQAEADSGSHFTYTCSDATGFAWVKTCIHDGCGARVEFEGAIASDETTYVCADHRDNPAFIDGVTWKIGTMDLPYIPSLDGGEANGFGPDLDDEAGYLVPWCKHCGEPMVDPCSPGETKPYFDTAEGEDDPVCKPGKVHYPVYIWTSFEDVKI